MPILLWAVVALAAGLGVMWVAIRRTLPRPASLSPGVELPATPLQRVARWSLAAGLFLAAGAATVLLVYGAEKTYEADQIRWFFTVLLLGVVAVLGGVSIWLKRQVGGGSRLLDERDQSILERAPAVQGPSILITLAIWVVGLLERFHEAGAVPTFYIILVFWSCLVVYLLAIPLGILLGYRSR